ncbi:hypothetical protein CALCODRAFT_488389 [Calocera cornea HHB12733]|uniref:Extracellular membrane protein CFEM domain-containing protein n=1 Tax=Calocera cornea HHB12733 TaxID=1353952 RepID=A0A165CI30_9BASI|nr:hypothetical protein CALCODRAFT_488389 [Calocera cornea HHB12733]
MLLLLLVFALPLLAGALSLPPRQTTICPALCSSASDISLIQSAESCPSDSLACICSYAFGLSLGCLDCILVDEGITLGTLKEECAAVSSSAGAGTAPTSTPAEAGQGSITLPTLASAAQTAAPSSTAITCTSQCSSPSDQSDIQAILACALTDAACICRTSLTLSSACLGCFLSQQGLTETQYQTLCASQGGGAGGLPGPEGNSSSSGTTTGTGTGTGAGPAPSAPPAFGSGAARTGGGWLGFGAGALVLLMAAMLV